MGNTKRTFEENVEMIADALSVGVNWLAQINAHQVALLEIAKRNSEHICGKCKDTDGGAVAVPPSSGSPLIVAAPLPMKDAEATAPADASELSYDELKAALIRRGFTLIKGIKMTTLRKLWAEHKDDPEVEQPPLPGAESAPAEPPAEAPAAPADPAAGLFDEPEKPAEKPAEVKKYTRDEAREAVSALFHQPITAEDKEAMYTVLKEKFGVTHFLALSEEKLGEFVAAMQKALAHA